MQRAEVLGMGFLGCVTAACPAREGHQGRGVDIDRDEFEGINAIDPPASDPGRTGRLQTAVAAGRLRRPTLFEEGVDQYDVAPIAVGTPSGEIGVVNPGADEKIVQAVGTRLAASLRLHMLVLRPRPVPDILEDKLAPRFHAAVEIRPDGPLRI